VAGRCGSHIRQRMRLGMLSSWRGPPALHQGRGANPDPNPYPSPYPNPSPSPNPVT